MLSTAQPDEHAVLPNPSENVDVDDTLPRAVECLESAEVFQTLRVHMSYIQDEYCTPFKWIPRAFESTDTVKQCLLDYAGYLYAAAQQVDRCYFQLAVFPDRMPECVKVMSHLDAETSNLYELCESQKVQLETAKKSLSDALEEKKRLADLLREKSKDADRFKVSWDEELALHMEFEQKYNDTDDLLQQELVASETMRQKIDLLQKELFQLDQVKRERTVRAITMMMSERTGRMMSSIFSSLVRVLTVERLTRLQTESEDGLKLEVRKLAEQRGTLTKKLHDTEDALENVEAVVARLKNDRLLCGERLLKRAFSPLDARELKTFVMGTWIRCMGELKLETKLLTIGPAYDKLGVTLAATEKREQESIAREHDLRHEFEDLSELKKKERTLSLIMRVLLLMKFRCERTKTIRELKDAAQKRFDFACGGRDERIMTLVKRMREDSDLVALQTHCSELGWELEQSLRGPPSKVVAPETGTLCSSCHRQVVYQDYLCAKRGAEITCDLPRIAPHTPEMSPKKRLHRAWQL
eukprot:GEMP01046759.1.p1 GENE.GEMP01046759.1~~GEMP01046759.1.p1  ORF type:complete len:555 (+),score=123.49 GEMP01046759.1:89-1666(+)